MVMTMERNEQKRSKLLKRPGTDGLQFDGGVPVLTGEMGLELCPLYLSEIGTHTFLRRLEEKSFDAVDRDYMAEFLMRQGIQPTKDNAFRLMMGARLHLMFADRLEGQPHHGQTQS